MSERSSGPRGLFVTGTDTGCGKTLVTSALLHGLRQRGFRVSGMKPVASGCHQTPAGLRNDDALQIASQLTAPADYTRINRYAMRPPIAPHIAARQAGVSIDFAAIAADYHHLASEADWVVVEGVGGWRVPLGEQTTVADLARHLGLPVVLVVGLRLGAINHALLSAEAIRADRIDCIGWVGSVIEPQMAVLEENIATLCKRLPWPLLGVVPHLPRVDVAAVTACLDFERLCR